MDLPLRENEPPQRSLVSTTVIGLYSALAVLALVIGAVRGDPDIYRLRETSGARLLLSPLVGVAVGLAIVGLSRLLTRHFRWARGLHRDFRGILGSLGRRDILVLAVASSVGEELLFRGALLPWLGLPLQALVFGLLHVGPGVRFLAWTASALVVGVLFGALALWLGDLGAPIAAHFVVNYLNLGHIVRTEVPPDDTAPTERAAGTPRSPGLAERDERPSDETGGRPRDDR